MNHVTCELTSITSYRIIVNGIAMVYKCKLIPIRSKDPNKQEYVNPTHNEAWARMLEASND